MYNHHTFNTNIKHLLFNFETKGAYEQLDDINFKIVYGCDKPIPYCKSNNIQKDCKNCLMKQYNCIDQEPL